MAIHSAFRGKKGNAGGGSSGGGGRILITVTFLGSAGPIRFLVNTEEVVGDVIQTALKNYAREGRLPVLGSDLSNFELYCPNSGHEALSQLVQIGPIGGRNFVLYKKKQEKEEETKVENSVVAKKGSGSLKAWINKSLGFMIHSR